MKVESVSENDFEKVFLFLEEHHNSKMSKDVWRKLFTHRWSKSDYRGTMLLDDDGRVVGFLSAIFSDWVIDGKTIPFCNTSTWVVNEKYRKHSLSLLTPLMQMKDRVFTGHTTHHSIFRIYTSYGYKILDDAFYLIAPNPLRIKCLFLNKTIDSRHEKFFENLDSSSQKIYDDHKDYSGLHLLLDLGGAESCYVSGQFKTKRGLKVFEIRHVSDAKKFAANISYLSAYLLRYYQVFFVYAESRFVGGKAPVFSVKRPLATKKIYRPIKNLEIDIAKISNFYSEVVLLDL